MTKETFNPKLWTPRSVAETQKIYAEWAETYDDDILGAGYATPLRIAQALIDAGADTSAPILDFGCGTGLSGLALGAVGFTTIDGTDVSAEMLQRAQVKDVYRKLWLGNPEQPLEIPAGHYKAVTATGVISLGAAPPTMLRTLLNAMDAGGFLSLSYNDATLADDSYINALNDVLNDGTVTELSREYGPHLPGKQMGSTVYVLQKS